MTPQDKAKELVLKFAFKGAQHEGEANKFALIAVDEILNEYWSHDTKRRDWWEQVKIELKNYNNTTKLNNHEKTI